MLIGGRSQPQLIPVGSGSQPPSMSVGSGSQPPLIPVGSGSQPQYTPVGDGLQPQCMPVGDGLQPSYMPVGGGLQPSYMPVGGRLPSPHLPGTRQTQHQPDFDNDVDSWIDNLDPSRSNVSLNMTDQGISSGTLLAYLAQQNLPKPQLPFFDGNPLQWVEFIVKFRDMVHRQQYMTDIQRSQLLMQNLRGEAKRSVKGYANDLCGYVLSLKTLKRLFGQRATIAQAVIAQVTKGKVVQNDDVRGLSELYYSVNDCLVTLQQLRYDSDLHSSETLRQATYRLPSRLMTKWAEHCLSIRRRSEEPNLKHLAKWLQGRVLTQKQTSAFVRKTKPEVRQKPPNKTKEDTITLLGASKQLYS